MKVGRDFDLESRGECACNRQQETKLAEECERKIDEDTETNEKKKKKKKKKEEVERTSSSNATTLHPLVDSRQKSTDRLIPSL